MEFQEVSRQRDALKCDLVKYEVGEAKNQRRIEFLDSEVDRYASECQRLSRLLGGLSSMPIYLCRSKGKEFVKIARRKYKFKDYFRYSREK